MSGPFDDAKTNTMIPTFFREVLNRLRTKSPKFFYILQLFGASLTFASYVPTMLERWTTLIVSQHFINFCEDIAKYAAGFTIAALLPAESKPTAMTKDGDVLKKLDSALYPFTAKTEQKQAEKGEVPVVQDPIPEEKP